MMSNNNPHEVMSLRKRLISIADFLAAFSVPGFTFGAWSDLKEIFPEYHFSPTADAFIQAAYEAGWVSPEVDWVEWTETPEFRLLFTDPVELATASPHQLACLLTSLIRKERFCTGTLAGAFTDGLLTRILQRATALLDELPSDKKTHDTGGQP